MYEATLWAHSFLRWGVVLAGVIAVFRALAGWTGRRPWGPADVIVGRLFIGFLDLQILLGLLLYFIYSPFTALAMDDFGSAMRSPDLRFWAVEHPFGAIAGLVLAHIGFARARKAADAARRHRLAAIFFGLALLAILVSIPWPGTANARPLLPR
jgi:hypothetical protein